ncbi:hypothetical protein V7S43_013683 [Phytophthora oleae]|uniref:Uncharacterized protein n=1 Tax=Phytophthora oleae TaxID=2107226 RepID=A0ABD3F3U1_9STRA
MYGPLADGLTTFVLFRGLARVSGPGSLHVLGSGVGHKVTRAYTAVTASRVLMAGGKDKIREVDLCAGSMGEAINPEAWGRCYEAACKVTSPIRTGRRRLAATSRWVCLARCP